MQKIAAENNLAETAFLELVGDGWLPFAIDSPSHSFVGL